MVRYIDADKFISWLDIGRLRSPSEICYSEGDVKIMIDMQPTADVEVVKRGQWMGIDGDQCSECNKYLSEIMDADSYYAIGFDINKIVACPFCGAKMDGKRSVE